jgi:hypothetical protein
MTNGGIVFGGNNLLVPSVTRADRRVSGRHYHPFETMRLLLLTLVCFFGLECVSAIAQDNSLGTWRLNEVKSDYDASAALFAAPILSRQAVDGRIEFIALDHDGKRIRLLFFGRYDGKPVLLSRKIGDYERISLLQLNANTFTAEYLASDGKSSAWERILVSPSGQRMTIALSGTSAGRDFRGTLIYERCNKGADTDDCTR